MIDDIEVRRFSFIEPEWSAVKNNRMDLFAAGLFYKYVSTWQMERWMLEFHPDVVNLHYLESPASFLYRTWQKHTFPLVVSLHGGDVDGEPGQSQAKMDRFLRVSNAANAVTACSQSLASQAEKLNPALIGKIQVIYNAVDSDRFAAAKPWNLNYPYILSVGQLSEHKGFDLLIHGFSMIAKKYPDVNLVISGDGNQRGILERMAITEDVKERVVFTGKISEDAVASLMKGCLFLAVPSRREPFGMVALEGMAAGKMVLATKVGGIPEFLPVPLNSYVLPDESSWRDALDNALRVIKKGKFAGTENQITASRFSWQKLTQNYLKVYENAIFDFKKEH
jgi:glycosyltransferase involved in cell wall biosynthesis